MRPLLPVGRVEWARGRYAKAAACGYGVSRSAISAGQSTETTLDSGSSRGGRKQGGVMKKRKRIFRGVFTAAVAAAAMVAVLVVGGAGAEPGDPPPGLIYSCTKTSGAGQGQIVIVGQSTLCSSLGAGWTT